ncbi:30S ribosomal protein S21 [bacterium]|nr:30S ribosomal protein S21 [bacterium]
MATINVREGESYESFMRRFRRACEKAGILRDYKRHEFYEKPSEKRKRKLIEARRKTWRKRQKDTQY